MKNFKVFFKTCYIKGLTAMLTILVSSVCLSAKEVTIDGIRYSITTYDYTASVVKGDKVSGDVIIPSTITYNGSSYTVTAIDNSALSYSYNLTSLELPTTIKTIGDYAFQMCTGMTSITIPSTVTHIGMGAFSDCANLTYIPLPPSLTAIYDETFRGCQKLKTVKIPNFVTSIGKSAFGSCHAITKINMSSYSADGNLNIPESVTKIDNLAFNGAGLVRAIIPNTVKELGTAVFSSCDELEEIILPNEITEIGDYTFQNCNNLKHCELPSSITSIGINAFFNCYSLNNILIPGNVTSIGSDAFGNCNSLKNVTSLPQTPPTLNGYRVFPTKVGKLKVNEESIVEYQNNSDWAQYFDNIVDMNNSPTSTSEFEYAYDNMYLPIKYTVIDGVSKTCKTKEGPVCDSVDGSYVLSGNKASGVLILPEHPRDIDLENDEYTLTEIGDCGFMGDDLHKSCLDIREVIMPNSIVKIGKSAFSGCMYLNKITWSNSLETIDDWAFSESSLKECVFPPSLKTIGYNVFYGTHLDYVKIPDSVISIGSLAFSNGVDNVEFESIETICRIGLGSFSRLQKLLVNGEEVIDLHIPEGVENITDFAFRESGIKQVHIPASVSSIGRCAFYCYTITEVSCKASIPPTLGGSAFRKDVSPTLRVPAGSVEAYRNSDWAQYFSEIVELPSSITVEIEGDGKVYYNAFDEVANGAEFEGNDFTFFILPDDGNRIAAITLDGEDLSANLINHRLTIADYAGNGTLKVEFAPEGEATLTVKGADNHSFTHSYKEGTRAKIALNPEDGWNIHSVAFNDEDVTDQLENNTFVTEPLYGDNNLRMVLVNDTPTEVETIESDASQVKISISGNTITIQGLEADKPVSVYDIEGRTIYTGYERIISLNHGAVYLLTTPSKTFKIGL